MLAACQQQLIAEAVTVAGVLEAQLELRASRPIAISLTHSGVTEKLR